MCENIIIFIEYLRAKKHSIVCVAVFGMIFIVTVVDSSRTVFDQAWFIAFCRHLIILTSQKSYSCTVYTWVYNGNNSIYNFSFWQFDRIDNGETHHIYIYLNIINIIKIESLQQQITFK